ncbi:uncharacterized protein Dana_GF11782 [Drosophila ananassae]|uniref:Uncharacterized protein n=1 Tax=Drosophila ananassae TaxID=7217 RepID=B3MG76_DROAN|nr:putative mediator of RNA polymerase II transcription subunit 29 [Drosophila ananassae]EDV36771.1 uncharacterized protein Dana_GF11782 [Drosophila ananassae]
MSGKLIMKRKRASQEEQQQQGQEVQPQQQQHRQPEDNAPAPEKRHRPLTPPAEEETAGYQTPPDAPNSILLEALQKIMELQSELDAFEQDLDGRDDYEAAGQDEDEEESPEDAEVAAQFAQPTPAQRSQAEALGFAMCARETLLFLQSEGIPTESPLYQTLLGKLVSQSDGLLQA